MNRAARVLLCGVLLAGCGGGGGGGDGGGDSAWCQSMNTSRSYTNGSCTSCTISDAPAVADGDLHSFADISMTLANGTATLGARSLNGEDFPAGSDAGAFVTTVTNGATSNATSLRTIRDGVAQETASGPGLELDLTRGGTGAQAFVHFTTTQPFDELEVTVSVAGSADPSAMDLRVYELCASGGV